MSVVLLAGLTSGSVAAAPVSAVSADSAPLSSTASGVSSSGTTASVNQTVSTTPAASAQDEPTGVGTPNGYNAFDTSTVPTTASGSAWAPIPPSWAVSATCLLYTSDAA